MKRPPVRVSIIGGGFGGSILAMILARSGLDVTIIERDRHPRFSIGESSTPMADLVLRNLADRYALPELVPFASYGAWKTAYPGIACGCKRGFSYFHQLAGSPFRPEQGRRSELLVEANPDVAHADTHWYRADVDAFLFEQARRRGATCLEKATVAGWDGRGTPLEVTHRGERIQIDTDFVVDASSGATGLKALLDLPEGDDLLTRSFAVYGHFEDVEPWETIYSASGGDASDHPFPAGLAALHHVFDGGWMWQLRFDNGLTSAGFVTQTPAPAETDAAKAWSDQLDRFPSIAHQFATARPARDLVCTGRLQRRAGQVIGPGWAMLPFAAGFVDPLHSTGIAHTLLGVQRLADMLINHDRDGWDEPLATYERGLAREIKLVDQIVHAGYAVGANFDAFIAVGMLYFLGATFAEKQARANGNLPGLISSEVPEFVEFVHASCADIVSAFESGNHVNDAIDRLTKAAAPFNVAGLCAGPDRTVYRYQP